MVHGELFVMACGMREKRRLSAAALAIQDWVSSKSIAVICEILLCSLLCCRCYCIFWWQIWGRNWNNIVQ